MGSGDFIFGHDHCGGGAMLPTDSYRDVLLEHARGHHFVASAWIFVAVVGVLVVIFV